MKYDIWQIAPNSDRTVNELIRSGFGHLSSYVLSARGHATPEEAGAFLDASALHDPFLLKDMDRAVARVRAAVRNREHIAVYGDYDVDGMTSIALLVRYLRGLGIETEYYIPDRLEEGYGLNAEALRHLFERGVSLVITVDSGITAIAEVAEAQSMGLDIIITDHHQCRDTLPAACAVVNPCRPDCSYPYKHLAGVGVAFKLICALADTESSDKLLGRFGDVVALGTVADVMPLTGENRTLVWHGLSLFSDTNHVGLHALMQESGLSDRRVTATTLGYTLAPRINAAGRMGRTPLAVELLLTDDAGRAAHLAAELCSLNRFRQQVENEIFTQALAMLEKMDDAPALVLAHEDWHSGVVGIVATRLAERFGKPTYLICMDGGHGKGSARSVRGINLVESLAHNSSLLTNYGGHELAAGFALHAEHIDAFREGICHFVAQYSAGEHVSSLSVDCSVPATLFTAANVTALQELEPFGTGNPTPIFALEDVLLEQVTPVGGGRHVKLQFRAGRSLFPGIFFGVDPLTLGFSEGDSVDIAFHADINTFQNKSSVQFQLCDIRLASPARETELTSLALYERFAGGTGLTDAESAVLCPDRPRLAAVWRYVRRVAGQMPLTDRLAPLARKITRESGLALSLGQLLVALDVFEEFHLIERFQVKDEISLEAVLTAPRADLSASAVLAKLR